MEKQKINQDETPDEFVETKQNGIGSMISMFFGSLFSAVKENIMRGADSIVDHTLDRVQEHVITLQKKMLRNLIITGCIVASLISLLLSLSFYLSDSLHWPRFAIFLILGAALLIVASIRANLSE